jgi:hypothetical protein
MTAFTDEIELRMRVRERERERERMKEGEREGERERRRERQRERERERCERISFCKAETLWTRAALRYGQTPEFKRIPLHAKKKWRCC